MDPQWKPVLCKPKYHTASIRIRFYDLRGSITTELKAAKIDEIVRLYITGHSLERKILSHYEHQDLQLAMADYFQNIRPLLDTIVRRAGELAIIDWHQPEG
jgi:hypothetical protein